MILVTLEETKAHLRVDFDDDDADIELKLSAVSELILSYVKADPLLVDPDAIPFRWKAAALIWVGILYKQRDGGSDEGLQLGEIPRSVSNLLWQDRTPSMR